MGGRVRGTNNGKLTEDYPLGGKFDINALFKGLEFDLVAIPTVSYSWDGGKTLPIGNLLFKCWSQANVNKDGLDFTMPPDYGGWVAS